MINLEHICGCRKLTLIARTAQGLHLFRGENERSWFIYRTGDVCLSCEFYGFTTHNMLNAMVVWDSRYINKGVL